MALVKHSAAREGSVEIAGLKEEAFELDLSSTDTLISLLAHMYARPIWSSLRELVQNAKDAGPGKVHVTRPTQANPTLVVSDFGRGMDESDMRALLQKVGASSKRGDVAMAGQLGIGSIAPMSVADAMSIASSKNGMKTVLTAWKNDSGDIRLSIAPPVPTDEPNGTAVSVPLHPDTFGQIESAIDVFRFSPELASRLVVDGEPLEPYGVSLETKVSVGEHEVVFRMTNGKTEVLPGALVLMNGIPMGANLERFDVLKDFVDFLESREAAAGRRSYYASTTMVLEIPPEAGLSFPPSREMIAVTRLNAAFLANACKRYLQSGMEELERDGLKPGCEAAVLSYWKMYAIDHKAKMDAVQQEVRKILNSKNGGNDYLTVNLSFTHWAGNAIPVVTLDQRIPAACGARDLNVEYATVRRTGSSFWRMQTRSLVPVDSNDAALGDKVPYSPGTKFKVIHWDALPDDGWSGVLARDLKAKQLLFELLTKPASHNYKGYETLYGLVLEKPIPNGHPMRNDPNAVFVDFGQEYASFSPMAGNPFVYADKEDDDEDGQTTGVRSKARRNRYFLSAAGQTARPGLPLDRPFTYALTLRGKYQHDNWKRLPKPCSTWDGSKTLVSWMRLFENAGIGSSYDVVELIPSEVEHIKRTHVPLLERLEDEMESWLAKLSDEEAAWLPFGAFAEHLRHSTPGMHRFFSSLQSNHLAAGTAPESPKLAEFLAGFGEAPGENAERFALALRKELKANGNAADQFVQLLDVANPKTAKNGTSSAFGMKPETLALPAAALADWLAENTLLARFTRLLWFLHAETGCNTNISSAYWLAPGANGRNVSQLVSDLDANAIAALIER